jgi:MFS family permease
VGGGDGRKRHRQFLYFPAADPVVFGSRYGGGLPCVASLVGDFFPARERAGIYGLILSGELIGTGIGFFISGEVSSLANWHWSFYAMAVPSLAIGWLVWRFLPEPERGKQGWISASELGSAQSSGAAQKVLEAKVQPRQHLVLRQDPTQRSL